MVAIKETVYKNYGKCLQISNEKLEILVTIDLGPRIIKCNLIGKENLMYNDVERKNFNDVSSLFGEGKNFYNYGGHRIWMSPEKFPDTYYPDNDKVLYSTFTNGAVFQPSKQDNTGIQLELSVTMDETEPKVTVTQKITNVQKTPITGAVWCLTVLDKNGTVIVPMPQEDTGLLSNRNLVLWPYTKMTDKRAFWGDKYIAIKQDPKGDGALKFGINNTAGKAACINKNQAFVKEFKVNFPDGNYPDRGCSCEVYTCPDFTECESISELKTIKKGESIVHTEVWTVIDNIEIGKLSNASLEEIASKIF